MAGSRSISTAVVFSLALNLRPAVTSLGSALVDVSVARNLTAAVLVALPLWAIGLGGWATPWVHSRLGTHRTVTLSLVTLGFSLVVRVLGGQVLLVAGTALACLAIALLGTLLPLLAKGFSRYTPLLWAWEARRRVGDSGGGQFDFLAGRAGGVSVRGFAHPAGVVSDPCLRCASRGVAVIGIVGVDGPLRTSFGGDLPGDGPVSSDSAKRRGAGFLRWGLPGLVDRPGVADDVARARVDLALAQPDTACGDLGNAEHRWRDWTASRAGFPAVAVGRADRAGHGVAGFRVDHHRNAQHRHRAFRAGAGIRVPAGRSLRARMRMAALADRNMACATDSDAGRAAGSDRQRISCCA